MKRLHKILASVGVMLCLGGGITSAIIAVQPKEQFSDLTLANIEALGIAQDEGGGGVVICSGGKSPCADVYDKNGNVIDQLTMP